ncbi:hypothetical protein FRC11_006993, partial [Ceratobasidium sp. 423]
MNDPSSAKSAPASPSSKDFPSPNTVFSHNLMGLVVWLYTFGKFFNAFQSCSLDMVTHILSVLHLYYFLDDWKSSLKALGYLEAQHFLTCDVQAIFKTMIKGFLGLWFLDENEDLDDSWNDSNIVCELDEEGMSLGVELDQLLRNKDVWRLSTEVIDDRMQALAGAGIAIEVEEQIALDAMLDHDHEMDWAATWKHLKKYFSPIYIPPLVLGDKVNHSALLHCGTGSDFDLTLLVTACKAHKTDFAKKAVRVGTLKPEVSVTTVTNDSVDSDTEVTTTLACSILVKQIHKTLKEAGEGAVGTSGGTRCAQYEGKFEATPTSGNAANTSTVSDLRAKEALKSQSESFKHGKIKCESLISGAGVTKLSPIKTRSYGIVLLDNCLWIGE